MCSAATQAGGALSKTTGGLLPVTQSEICCA
jgi:hypothetical protein